MNELPAEIIYKIHLYLDVSDLISLESSGRYMWACYVRNEDYIIKHLYKNLPEIILNTDKKLSLKSYWILYGADNDYKHFDKCDEVTIDLFLLNNYYDTNWYDRYGFSWVIKNRYNENIISYYIKKYIEYSIAVIIITNFEVYGFWILSELLYYNHDEEYIINIYNLIPIYIDLLRSDVLDDLYYDMCHDPLIRCLDKKYYKLASLIIEKYDIEYHNYTYDAVKKCIDYYDEDVLPYIDTELIYKFKSQLTKYLDADFL